MKNIKELERRKINLAAQNFLSEHPNGDLYDAYLILCDAKESGNGNHYANYYVDIPYAFDVISVDAILDLIEAAVVNAPEIPEFIQNIDWKLLTDQKASLLNVIAEFNETESKKSYYKDSIEHLTGIVHLIDSLQDYACDTLGFDETLVFPDLGKQ